MNGIHDLGGMHGFGPVVREENEPDFHAPWERTVLGMMQAIRVQRVFNVDEMRRWIEQMDPLAYLQASYYERWLHSLEANLVEKGVLSPEEIERRASQLADVADAAARHDDPALAERVLESARLPQPTADAAPPARFDVGDDVVVRNDHPVHHTRVPRYIRGKRGVIAGRQGAQVFPDTHAHGLGRQLQLVYSVRFTGAELWGSSAEPGQTLFIDLWESYLEPATLATKQP